MPNLSNTHCAQTFRNTVKSRSTHKRSIRQRLPELNPSMCSTHQSEVRVSRNLLPTLTEVADRSRPAVFSPTIVQALYQRSLDFVKAESYDFLNVEVREFTFNRCPFQ